MKNIVSVIKNILFPKDIKCLVCNKELNSNTLYCICDDCAEKLPYNNGKTCLRCDEPLTSMANYCIECKNKKPYFKNNRSIFLYDGAIKQMIRGLKFDNKKYLVETMANFIASEVVKMQKRFDFIVPVPIHSKRLKKRGYNQSYLLCKSLQEKLHHNVRTDILLKPISTLSQTNLSKNQRQENLKNAFKVSDKQLVKGKTFLIIDDVFTTGSTINECAKTLLDAGAKEVCSLTLAHAHHKISTQ